jgi:uncharacterized protein
MAQHIRRNPRNLPSVRKHGFSAVLLLAIIGLSTVSWLNMAAKNKPVSNTVTEILLPEPLTVETSNEALPLPDLLEPDNIPQSTNPTDQVNMIGDPQNKAISTAINKPMQTEQISIDGRIINDNQQTITKYTPLVRAPIAGLSRTTPSGRVPHPHEDGRTALSAYAKPFAAKADTKYVSLVVGGLGLNPAITRKAIDNLPGAVTLSFAADAPGLQGWINKARAHGHEVMIELPMQGSGPLETRTLTIAGPDLANIKNLEYLLSRAQGYFAVTNYDGDRLVNDETALLPIIQILKEAGLGFIYDGAIDSTRIAPLAKREGFALVSANGYIDEKQQDMAYVQRNIQTIAQDSYDNVPIGMGFAYAGTIDGIKSWLVTKPKDTEIAPVSYALKKR